MQSESSTSTFHILPLCSHPLCVRSSLQFAAMNDVQRAELRRYVGMAKSGGMAKATAGCLDYLETEGLAFQLNIKCVHIGVHRSNRGGMGVDLHHMHELMRTICQMGYVEQGIGARVCLELDSSPDCDATRHSETSVFFDELIRQICL